MSLKGDKYETAEEVRFRLENTVVLYDGKPVYISRVNVPEPEDRKEIARVYFFDLPLMGGRGKVGEGKETRKYLSSKNFDLAPFKMGYMNHGGQATFVSRAPVRQNRQGLSNGTAVFTNVKGQRSEVVDFNTMIRSEGFVDMVNGKYPDFKTAGDMLGDKDISSVAVSRSFAFNIDHDLQALVLVHKGVKCGLALKGDKALRIPPKFHFLREEMEDHRIPIVLG